MTHAVKKIHFPKTRLGELVARPGGVTQEDAVAAAQLTVEESRGLALEAIENAVCLIEGLVGAAKGGRLAEANMAEILNHADRIVTMTATFGLDVLEGVVKSLCDVTEGLMARGSNDAAPIAVHVRAMRFLTPGGTQPDAAQSRKILSELTKVRARFAVSGSANGAFKTGTPEKDRRVAMR